MAYIEITEVEAYIPNFGQYIPEREGFIYYLEKDQYEFKKEGGTGAILSFKKGAIAKDIKKRRIKSVKRYEANVL